MTKRVALPSAGWDYNQLTAGLKNTRAVAAPKFDPGRAQQAVEKQLAVEPGAWETEGTLFVIEITFDPNQSVFAEDRYANDYQKALQVAQTYGGALVVVEGHSDPLGILQAQQKGERKEVLDQMRQVAKNLSLARANSVRSSFIQYSRITASTLISRSSLPLVAVWRRQSSTRPAPRRNGPPIVACASSSSRSRRNSRSSSRWGTNGEACVMCRRTISATLLLLVVTLLMAGAAAQSQTDARQATQAGEASLTRNFYFIFDGSGSMSESLNKQCTGDRRFGSRLEGPNGR